MLPSADSNLDADARRRELLTALKTSGTYNSIKDSLRRCAVRIVRERFVGLPGTADAVGEDLLSDHGTT